MEGWSPMFSDVMVDIETTGTDPEHAAIIQITAVRFNLTTREIDHNWFDQCLLVPSARFWAEDTRAFWAKHREVLAGIRARMRDPAIVMREFYDWVGVEDDLHFWSKPLSFDFPFIASYFRQYELPNPFPFWLGRDLRTHIAAVAPDFDEKSVPFEGEAHNAIFDVLHQIKLLYAAQESKA